GRVSKVIIYRLRAEEWRCQAESQGRGQNQGHPIQQPNTIKRSLHNTSYKLTDRHRANRQGARLSQRTEHPYIPPNDLTEFNHRWTQMNTQKRSSKNQGPSARGAPKIMVETQRQGAFETWSLALLRWQKFGGWCFFHP